MGSMHKPQCGLVARVACKLQHGNITQASPHTALQGLIFSAPPLPMDQLSPDFWLSSPTGRGMFGEKQQQGNKMEGSISGYMLFPTCHTPTRPSRAATPQVSSPPTVLHPHSGPQSNMAGILAWQAFSQFNTASQAGLHAPLHGAHNPIKQLISHSRHP